MYIRESRGCGQKKREKSLSMGTIVEAMTITIADDQFTD